MIIKGMWKSFFFTRIRNNTTYVTKLPPLNQLDRRSTQNTDTKTPDTKKIGKFAEFS